MRHPARMTIGRGAPAADSTASASAGASAGSADARKRAARIRLLAMDVDGTLTDGSLLIGPRAELAKAFSVRDGFGLTLLARAGIELALVTGRESPIVERRAAELGIRQVHQAVRDKLETLRQVCRQSGITLDQAAFVGDDWPDLPAMTACGLGAAPADAVEEVRRAAHWVSAERAGHGAVRELAMFILEAQGRRTSSWPPTWLCRRAGGPRWAPGSSTGWPPPRRS